MTRSVGGVARLERAECDTAVGGPVTGTDGTGEAAAYSSASGTVGTGAAGASGTPGASQPHRTHGQPADTGTASSPQQDTCAAAQVEVGEQQDRFPPGGQHDFAVGVKGAARSWDGTAGVRADVAQLQARAGAAVPIAVETASSRQTNGRTRLKIGMRASYTRPLARVNPIRPPVGQVPRAGPHFTRRCGWPGQSLRCPGFRASPGHRRLCPIGIKLRGNSFGSMCLPRRTLPERSSP